MTYFQNTKLIPEENGCFRDNFEWITSVAKTNSGTGFRLIKR